MKYYQIATCHGKKCNFVVSSQDGMKKVFLFAIACISALCSCHRGGSGYDYEWKSADEVSEILPITGTFVNLAYQDVRNLYTNPPHIDNTDPRMWKEKIGEMKKMGMEYLVFMAIANEGKAYYPSALMPWHYPEWRESPVDAIMDEAERHGMKVFMSTGWAVDQDDNLRDPKIKARQMEMMEELAGLYGDHPAFHGWYLPVEDCLGPVLTDYAVEAVNALTMRARELTPSAKILISPYGIFNSNFDDPRYEQQLSRLTVDIIAYQDEIGCVRERYPLDNLRKNWKKLRAIHDKTGVEMWANCESFTWEKGTNDRSSALIPASFSRLLSQMSAASAGGADRIISFMMLGIYEPSCASEYALGQPHWSNAAGLDYMLWLGGNRRWRFAGNAFSGRYGDLATEDPANPRWSHYSKGTHEITVDLGQDFGICDVMVRMLNCAKDGINPPRKLFLFTSEDGEKWELNQIKDCPVFPNTLHDSFIDHVVFELAPDVSPLYSRYLKIAFTVEDESYFDEIIINPEI